MQGKKGSVRILILRMAVWECACGERQHENVHLESGSMRMRGTIILYTKYYSVNVPYENGSMRIRIVIFAT